MGTQLLFWREFPALSRETTDMFRTFVLSLFVVAADESLVQLIPRIEHAMITGSVEQLEQYRGTLLASVDKASGNEAMLMRYTLAYVDWRLYPLLMSDPKKRGDAYLKEAREAADGTGQGGSGQCGGTCIAVHSIWAGNRDQCLEGNAYWSENVIIHRHRVEAGQGQSQSGVAGRCWGIIHAQNVWRRH